METEHKSNIRRLALMIVDELDSTEGLPPGLRRYCRRIMDSMSDLLCDYGAYEIDAGLYYTGTPPFRGGIL